MQVPDTQYARRGGRHIAYQLWGGGERDILDLGFGTYISIDETAEQPQWLRYTERLASCGRLIRFDRSGVGLSDTPLDTGELTLGAWAEDAIAVMDAAGSERAAVLAASASSQMAFMLASGHPERIDSLILLNASARYVEAPDYRIGIPVRLMNRFREGLDPDSARPPSDEMSDLRLFAPSCADDPEFRLWWSRASKRGAAPATSATLNIQIAQSDLRDLLPGITAPTLVLHREDVVAPSVSHGRYVAEHIPGARFVTLQGGDVVPFAGDIDALVDEIQQFITGERYQPLPNRLLATVLISDIVDSTGMASRLGDRRWAQLLLDHQDVVRRQLDRFGGEFVKDTGDGFVAVFDTPSNAILCALALRDGAIRLGMHLRSGLHTGEIEQVQNEIRGIAVHVAARLGTAAAADEVLVSGVVVDLVEGSSIRFDDRGVHELKGVSETRRIWSALPA